MNKRILLGAASIVPLLAVSCAGDPAVSVPGNARPNIIFIFSDNLGIGGLSCYGATRVATPHIDRLAVQGQRFTNVYAASATRLPSSRCPKRLLPTAATTCPSCSEQGTSTANMSSSRTARIRWLSFAANGNTWNRATGRAMNTASRSNWAIRPGRSFSASRKTRASGTTWRNSIPGSSKSSQQNLMP